MSDIKEVVQEIKINEWIYRWMVTLTLKQHGLHEHQRQRLGSRKLAMGEMVRTLIRLGLI